MPDCLYPPKGASAEYQTPPLTFTVPTRSRDATCAERSSSPPNTVPDSPYGESLAIRTASSSPSCAITTSTGPKISSRATREPPSATFLTVAAASAITARPVAVEPVNETMSTRGSVDNCAPIRWSLDVTILTTPGGKSVCSAMIRPSTAAHHGVSGAGLRTRVLPAASAGPTLARLI
ncbi:Uncharacterised protein [Mycobacteroides abscessus subsp. abscessus]|nr:Uncharacterised protein [Mycobacteroides abscessus subsp. abscessus]